MLPPGLTPEISYKIFHAPPFLLLPVECQCSGLPGKPYVEDGGAPAPRTLLFTADTCQPFWTGTHTRIKPLQFRACSQQLAYPDVHRILQNLYAVYTPAYIHIRFGT